MRRSTWLPESATEWMDSASIEAEPLIRNAPNLVMAMPMFAPSAAMIALVPPSLLIGASRAGSSWARLAPDTVAQVRHVRRRQRVEAGPEGEVDGGEVGQGDQPGDPGEAVLTGRAQLGDPYAAGDSGVPDDVG